MRRLESLLCGLFFIASAVDAQSFHTRLNNTCGTCARSLDRYDGGWWTLATPTTTLEAAATVVIIHNNRTNTTRTSTIFNLPGNQTLPPTNSAGTIVHIKILYSGSTYINTVLTWPTGYISFSDGISVEGTVPAALPPGQFRNATSCITQPSPSGALSLFPTRRPAEFPTSSRTFSFTESHDYNPATSAIPDRVILSMAFC